MGSLQDNPTFPGSIFSGILSVPNPSFPFSFNRPFRFSRTLHWPFEENEDLPLAFLKMSFGWSAGDIVTALQLLNKVRVALKDTSGASSNYQEETGFLQSVSLTLTHAEALRCAPLDPGISRNLQQHFELIRPPLQQFLSDAHKSFEASLGSKPTRGKISLLPRKLQWALSTSIEVKTLREKIGLSISAV